MTVSIIIPNRNNANRLRTCLHRVIQVTAPGYEVEIIVVDNGSVDDSLEVIAELPVLMIQELKILTPFAARNTGIKAAKGEIIVLLDSNCIPGTGWLIAGLARLQNGYDIVGGPLHFEPIPFRDWVARFDRIYGTIYAEDLVNRTSLPSGNLFIKKTVFDKIGLFLPHARGLGDIEWTNRAHQAGYQLGWATAAAVKYPAKSGFAFLKKMHRLGKGKKELQLYRFRTLWTWSWLWQILKNLLPPSPDFVKRMHFINQKEQLGIPWVIVFLLCWLTKLTRCSGMVWGEVSEKILQYTSSPKY